MSNPIRILSIDGGGIRGIIPAMVLQAILGDRKAKDVFHLIAGTSTGGIIACGLAKPDPLPLNEILDLYVTHGGAIFRKTPRQKLPFFSYFRPQYAAMALEAQLKQRFGNTMLSEVQDVELLVPSYAIHLPHPTPNDDTRAPMFFRSWQARGQALTAPAHADDYNFSLKEICRATSAAPTYFPPATIRSKSGQDYSMVDGGVFANNPTICAMVEAYRLYHATDFLVVSLGTGNLQAPINPRKAVKWGKLGWVERILDVLMDGNSDTVRFEAYELMDQNSFFRFDAPLGKETPQGDYVDENFDDATPKNIKALQEKADQLVAAAGHQIAKLKALLQDDKAPVTRMSFVPGEGILAAKARHALERGGPS
jgi:patatin-like phospholipase/acyl hydrolase